MTTSAFPNRDPVRECYKLFGAGMRYKTVVTGALIALMAGSAWTMTLGRTRGAAWIGQPLELQVAVQLDSGQTAADLCPEADVFYGDSKVDPTRVRVLAESASQSDSANLRLSSSVPVDEPMVTVYLRAGCSTKSTRRYVLLADFPTENLAPPARSVAEPVPFVPPSAAPVPVPAVPPAATAPAGPTNASNLIQKATSPPPASEVAPPRTAPLPKQPVQRATPAAPRPSTKVASAPAQSASPAKPRLKLDPIENLAERIKTLEATTSAVPLEEMVKDNQRMQQLQSDMQALLAQAAKNEASMLALRERLERAEAERVSVFWVYVLGGLLLACIAGMFLIWNRRTETTNWQNSQAGTTVMAPPVDHQEERPPLHSDSLPTQLSPLIDPREVAGVDVDLMDIDADAFGRLLTQRTTDHAPLATAHSAHQSRTHFNNESSFDIRQQAEFFMKLGKTDQALEVLEQRIRANPVDCPLVYLDILRIANANSLKTDFRQFRDEFEKIFNARVPEFALFKDEGRTLDAYPALLQHITALWPAASVMDVVEACILRDPELMNAEPFDLAAFRELITLHGLVHAHHFADAKGENSDSQHVSLDI